MKSFQSALDYALMGDLSLSRAALSKALFSLKSIKNTSKTALLSAYVQKSCQVGLKLVSKGHIDSGIQYLNDITETIINKLSEKPQNILKTRVFITLSWIYKKVGNLEKALKTIEFALDLSKKHEIHRFLPSIYLTFADIFALKNDYKNSLKFNIRALELIKEKSNNHENLIKNLTEKITKIWTFINNQNNHNDKPIFLTQNYIHKKEISSFNPTTLIKSSRSIDQESQTLKKDFVIKKINIKTQEKKSYLSNIYNNSSNTPMSSERETQTSFNTSNSFKNSKSLQSFQCFDVEFFEDSVSQTSLNIKLQTHKIPFAVLKIQRFYRMRLLKLKIEFYNKRKNKEKIFIGNLFRKIGQYFFKINICLDKKKLEVIWKFENLSNKNEFKIITDQIELIFRSDKELNNKLKIAIDEKIQNFENFENNENFNNLQNFEKQTNQILTNLSKKKMSKKTKQELIQLIQKHLLKYLFRRKKEVEKLISKQVLFRVNMRTSEHNYLHLTHYVALNQPKKSFLSGFLINRQNNQKQIINTLIIDETLMSCIGKPLTKESLWQMIAFNEEENRLNIKKNGNRNKELEKMQKEEFIGFIQKNVRKMLFKKKISFSRNNKNEIFRKISFFKNNLYIFRCYLEFETIKTIVIDKKKKIIFRNQQKFNNFKENHSKINSIINLFILKISFSVENKPIFPLLSSIISHYNANFESIQKSIPLKVILDKIYSNDITSKIINSNSIIKNQYKNFPLIFNNINKNNIPKLFDQNEYYLKIALWWKKITNQRNSKHIHERNYNTLEPSKTNIFINNNLCNSLPLAISSLNDTLTSVSGDEFKENNLKFRFICEKNLIFNNRKANLKFYLSQSMVKIDIIWNFSLKKQEILIPLHNLPLPGDAEMQIELIISNLEYKIGKLVYNPLKKSNKKKKKISFLTDFNQNANFKEKKEKTPFFNANNISSNNNFNYWPKIKIFNKTYKKINGILYCLESFFNSELDLVKFNLQKKNEMKTEIKMNINEFSFLFQKTSNSLTKSRFSFNFIPRIKDLVSPESFKIYLFSGFFNEIVNLISFTKNKNNIEISKKTRISLDFKYSFWSKYLESTILIQRYIRKIQAENLYKLRKNQKYCFILRLTRRKKNFDNKKSCFLIDFMWIYKTTKILIRTFGFKNKENSFFKLDIMEWDSELGKFMIDKNRTGLIKNLLKKIIVTKLMVEVLEFIEIDNNLIINSKSEFIFIERILIENNKKNDKSMFSTTSKIEYNKALNIINRFIKVFNARNKLKKLKESTKIILRQAIVNKLGNYVRICFTLFQKKQLLFIMFINLNKSKSKGSNYYIDLKELNIDLANKISSNIIPKNELLHLIAIILKNLQLDLIFENVFPTIKHPLVLIPENSNIVFTNLKHPIIKMREITCLASGKGVTNQKENIFHKLTRLQINLRKILQKQRELKLNLLNKQRNLYGDLISTCFRKIDSSKYFLIKIFKDKNKEEYTIVAISIFPKGLKYSTKFKNKGEMLINMQGTDISTILSENLEISNNKLRINFKYNPMILEKNDEILINELPFIDNNTNDDPLLIFQNEGLNSMLHVYLGSNNQPKTNFILSIKLYISELSFPRNLFNFSKENSLELLSRELNESISMDLNNNILINKTKIDPKTIKLCYFNTNNEKYNNSNENFSNKLINKCCKIFQEGKYLFKINLLESPIRTLFQSNNTFNIFEDWQVFIQISAQSIKNKTNLNIKLTLGNVFDIIGNYKINDYNFIAKELLDKIKICQDIFIFKVKKNDIANKFNKEFSINFKKNRVVAFFWDEDKENKLINLVYKYKQMKLFKLFKEKTSKNIGKIVHKTENNDYFIVVLKSLDYYSCGFEIWNLKNWKFKNYFMFKMIEKFFDKSYKRKDILNLIGKFIVIEGENNVYFEEKNFKKHIERIKLIKRIQSLKGI